jgi:hypothetical protein
MPAFTAIGIAVAGAITGATFATVGAALAAGAFGFAAIATITTIGVSYLASRLINGNPNKGANSAVTNQGGRIQIPPATNNKIPIVYGRAFMNGIITDARLISTDSKTNNVMYYSIVLSEHVDTTGVAYTVNNIYWNDMRLVFKAGTDSHITLSGKKYVEDTPDPLNPGLEDFTDTNFDGKVQVRIYAGNSESAQQIFPANNKVNAYDMWPSDGSSRAFWNNAEYGGKHGYQGLVFAVVRVEYDQDKGFTGLPTITFDIENTLTNPALVWRDYMLSDRYGVGLSLTDLDTASISSYESFCDELIRYTDIDNVTSTQKRYEINGILDSANPVKQNIDIILQNGGAWMSYNTTTGLWSVVPKKAVSAAFEGSIVPGTGSNGAAVGKGLLTVSDFTDIPKSYGGRIEAGQVLTWTGVPSTVTIESQVTPLLSTETTGQLGRYQVSLSTTVSTQDMTTENTGLLVFNDDNMLSGITLSSTRLDDLYNKAEAEYFDKYNRDQRAYNRISIPDANRNPNEPDNTLRIGLDMTNNNVQAELLSNIELKQSRDDLVIQFTASHYGIQALAGDVIKVYTGTAEDSYYPYGWGPKLFRVTRVKEVEREDGSLVADITALEHNYDVYTVENIQEFTTSANIGIAPLVSSSNLLPPNNDDVNIVNPNPGGSVPNFTVRVVVPTTGGPYDEIQVWYAEYPIASNPPTSSFIYLKSHYAPGDQPIYEGGSTHDIVITELPANQAGKQYYIKVRMGSRGVYSDFTDVDVVTPILPGTEWDPDPGAGSQEVLNIKNAILKLDFGKVVIPNNGFWLWKTMTQIDFGSLATATSPYQLDLGKTRPVISGVVDPSLPYSENSVTASTDIEAFIWQDDPGNS